MKTERRDENFMNKISSCRSRDTLKSRRNNRVGRKNWMYSCVYVYCVCNSLGDEEQIASRVEFTIEVHRNRLCVIAYTSQRIFQYRTIPSKHTASKSRYIDINAHTCFIYIHTHLCTRLLKNAVRVRLACGSVNGVFFLLFSFFSFHVYEEHLLLHKVTKFPSRLYSSFIFILFTSRYNCCPLE